jgi:hypothetical protein
MAPMLGAPFCVCGAIRFAVWETWGGVRNLDYWCGAVFMRESSAGGDKVPLPAAQGGGGVSGVTLPWPLSPHSRLSLSFAALELRTLGCGPLALA